VSDKAFRDLVTPRRDGGVDIEIDHPLGPLRWELPGERALDLRDAIVEAVERGLVIARLRQWMAAGPHLDDELSPIANRATEAYLAALDFVDGDASYEETCAKAIERIVAGEWT
jgi:DNA-binding transcriptional LysR family regulator